MDVIRARAGKRYRPPELLLASRPNICRQTPAHVETPYLIRRAILNGAPDTEDGTQSGPSGANLRRVAIDPRPTRATTVRPSASTHRDENVAEASALQMDLVTPLFQPLRGETGRSWFASEYGITQDNSSLISSE